jgi:type II secretory pathway pseudopilin PulG
MEVVIALCVMGVLTATIVPLSQTIIAYSRAAQTRKSFDYVMRSLTVYVALNDRLPWPGPGGLEDEESQQPVGHVPYKTLALEQQIAQDGHKNTLMYVVNPVLTGWIPNIHTYRTSNPFLEIEMDTAKNLRVILADGSDAIPLEESCTDFCAAVLISIPPKSEYSLNDVVQINGDNIVVTTPPISSGVIVRWISRNNIVVLERLR